MEGFGSRVEMITSSVEVVPELYMQEPSMTTGPPVVDGLDITLLIRACCIRHILEKIGLRFCIDAVKTSRMSSEIRSAALRVAT